jgi:hypothetical protein
MRRHDLPSLQRNPTDATGKSVGDYVRDVWARIGEWRVVPSSPSDWEVVSSPDDWEIVEAAAAKELRQHVNPYDLIE